ncbi:MAG: hypothetical protein ABW252_15535 [Polyangiales bacterium]
MRELRAALAEGGADVSVCSALHQAHAISEDGYVILGSGVCGGRSTNFVARLPR